MYVWIPSPAAGESSKHIRGFLLNRRPSRVSLKGLVHIVTLCIRFKEICQNFSFLPRNLNDKEHSSNLRDHVQKLHGVIHGACDNYTIACVASTTVEF